MQYQQSIFQKLDNSLRTKRIREDVNSFLLETYSSSFVTYEIPPSLYEVSDIKNTLDQLLKADVSFNCIIISKRNHN